VSHFTQLYSHQSVAVPRPSSGASPCHCGWSVPCLSPPPFVNCLTPVHIPSSYTLTWQWSCLRHCIKSLGVFNATKQLSRGTHNWRLIPASCSCYALYDSTQSPTEGKGNILGGKGGLGIQLIIQVHLISGSKER